MKAILISFLVTTLTISFVHAEDQDKENQRENRTQEQGQKRMRDGSGGGQNGGQGLGHGRRGQMKGLTFEERKAKRKEIYDNSTPERQAEMDRRSAEMEKLAEDMGFDINTEEGMRKLKRANREERRDQRGNRSGNRSGMRRGPKDGSGQGQGPRDGSGQGRRRGN